MNETEKVLGKVRAALESEARIHFRDRPVTLSFADGDLIMEGEVVSVAAKRLALRQAAAIPEVLDIIDRLHVAPAQAMGDKEIREHVRNKLLQEGGFRNCTIRETIKGEVLTVREAERETEGDITVTVDEEGVVTLTGTVPGMAQKRLAGVLAWWVPGSRDVINGLGVEPPEPDRSGELSDTVRLVLEKDPFVNAGQIRIGVKDNVVRLTGLVPTESERDMAEKDAWYVFGVDDVENRIEIHA